MPTLDATVLIDADRNDPALLKQIEHSLQEEEALVVPIQAAIEYCAGRKDPAAGMRKLRGSFWVVVCGEEIALEAARLAKKALENGRFTGWSDVQVAATARVLGMSVLTRNMRHFEGLGVPTKAY